MNKINKKNMAIAACFILVCYCSGNTVHGQAEGLNSGGSKITLEIVEEYSTSETSNSDKEKEGKESLINGNKLKQESLPKTGEYSNFLWGFIGVLITCKAILLKKWATQNLKKKRTIYY